MDIGQRLKEVRQTFGHTQAVIAEAVGISPKLYHAYERNRARTPIEVLISLSEFYGYYSIDMLLGIKKEFKQEKSTVLTKYHGISAEKRKIIDYILSLNN